ncbi:MAG: oxidoreductase [Bacteroidota bacterium]
MRLLLITLIISFFCCSSPERIPSVEISSFPLTSSLRAIDVLSEQAVWLAGTGGQFGFTEDGGATWQIDSIRLDSVIPEFRAIRVVEDTILLMSVSSPALMFRSEDKGNNWTLTYREDHPACYYNSMAFWDHAHGMVVGDPTENCLSILITHDAGKSWIKRSCENIPPLKEGEAQFAASNTNVIIQGEHTWVVTGASAARVFYSADRGENWEVYDSPIQQGGQMTGIFSADFHGPTTGILFGGDWENQEDNHANKAVTIDGGKNWQLVADGAEPGYRSCVQYQPHTNGKSVWAVGMLGMSYSPDGGKQWVEINRENYYTIRFTEDGQHAWLAGRNKIGKMRWK